MAAILSKGRWVNPYTLKCVEETWKYMFVFCIISNTELAQVVKKQGLGRLSNTVDTIAADCDIRIQGSRYHGINVIFLEYSVP